MQWLASLVSAVVIFFSGIFGVPQAPAVVQTSIPVQNTPIQTSGTQARASQNTVSTVIAQKPVPNKKGTVSSATDYVCSDLMPGSSHQYAGSDYYVIKGDVACSLYTGEPIAGANTTSFSSLKGGAYAKDKNNVYCNDGNADTELSGADPASFQVLLAVRDPEAYGDWNYRYAKDKNTVYLDCNVFSIADPATFALLNYSDGTFSGFSKDTNHIYTNVGDQGEVFPADYASFVLLNDPQGDDSNYAEDKNHVYYGGAISQVDGVINHSTFKALGWGHCSSTGYPTDGPFAEDDKYVYDNDRIMPNVSPSTFNVNMQCM